MCEFGDGKNIQPQHGKDFLNWMAGKISKKPKSSIVHQHVHGDAPLVEPRLQLSAGSWNGKIDSFDDDIYAVPLPKLLRQFFHWLGATRRQNHVCFSLSQKRCKLDSESARRAGYQRPFAFYCVHIVAGESAPDRNGFPGLKTESVVATASASTS